MFLETDIWTQSELKFQLSLSSNGNISYNSDVSVALFCSVTYVLAETFGLSYGPCPNNASHPVTYWDNPPNGPTAESWPWGITLIPTGRGMLSSFLLLRCMGFKSPVTSWTGSGHPGMVTGPKSKIKCLWSCRQTFAILQPLKAAFEFSIRRRGMKIKTKTLSSGAFPWVPGIKLINWLTG